MNQRSRRSLFVGDVLLGRLDDSQRVGLWEFMGLLFPEDTSRKQFECAHKFMKLLSEQRGLESSSLRQLMTKTEYNTLVNFILPKLLKFGLIRIIGQRGRGRSYRIEFEKTFSDRLRHLGMEWFRVYTRYGDLHGQP